MDKWLSHPTSLKIISVILGLLLWAVVHIDPGTSPQTVTTSIDTKTLEASVITVEGLDKEKYVLTAMEPTVVRLDVQGRLSDLVKYSSDDDYVVKVDLKDAKAGISELPLTASIPKGIQVVNMSPRTVTVQLEEIVTKTFQLQLVSNGTPAAGYVAGTPALVSGTPEVQVTLPKDDMSRVGLVAVELDVTGAEKTVSNKKAKIIVYDSEGLEMTNAVIAPETVHVEVKVTPPFKTLPLQISYTGSMPADTSLVSIKPSVEQVTVYGEQSVLDGLQIYNGAVVDLTKVKQTGSMQVKLQAIDGIKSMEPAEITVDIVVAQNATKTLSDIPITIEGTASGTGAVFRTPANGKYELMVSGAESVLSRLTIGDIKIIANVQGLSPGVHDVPLQIEVPEYVQTVVEEGRTLSVSIEVVEDVQTEAEPEDTSTDEPPATDKPVDAVPESNTEDGSSNSSAGGTTNNT